jgi:deoxycytidylate deaminase
MSRQERIINTLIPIAERSTMFNRHGAALTKGGKIYATGANNKRTYINRNVVTSVHAEIDAIRTSLNMGIYPSGDIWIIQYTRSGIFGQSMPCESCLRTIKKYNISRIFYTNGNGEITVMKTCDAVSNWVSGAQMKYGLQNLNL